jgi:circadian clock protein KaiC
MNSVRPPCVRAPTKAQTGITGFDEITGGGLPRGRTTLLVGGPGSGKTIFALQFLAHGARNCKEPGIFAAFEETSKRIAANAESFGWKLAELRRGKLFFLDAQPMPDLVQSGNFDLGGMLAALGAQAKEMGARRIVFDALDIVLALLPDAAVKRREVYRLHEWLLARELTGLITLRADRDETSSVSQQPFGFMQFMVDCAVILNHSVVLGVSQRNLRVQKYRGSSFDEDESPFVIAQSGLEVRMKSLQVELEAQQAEKARLARTTEIRKGELPRGRTRMRELRGADAAISGRK